MSSIEYMTPEEVEYYKEQEAKEDIIKQKHLQKRRETRKTSNVQRETNRAYRQRNKERIKTIEYARNKHKYATDPDYRKRKNAISAKSNFKKRYGITLEEKENMLEAQDYRCAICSTDTPQGDWQTDHCHRTGKVRGIVCISCNMFLGKVETNPIQLQQILRYIEEHTCT